MLVGRNCFWAGWQMIVGVLFDLNVYHVIQGITSLVALHIFFSLGFWPIHPVYSYLHWCSGPTWDICSPSSVWPLLVGPHCCRDWICRWQNLLSLLGDLEVFSQGFSSLILGELAWGEGKAIAWSFHKLALAPIAKRKRWSCLWWELYS